MKREEGKNMFDIQDYYKAESVDDAVRLLGEHPSTRCIAGGTDILVRLRELHHGYDKLVDIHHLEELKGITLLEDGTLRIGAGATFTDIMTSPLVQQYMPMLGEAAASVAGPQIRNVGTIGGNLCNGAVSADTTAPVLACDALLRLRGPNGERQVPALGFHTGPGKVALLPGEILLSVDVPAQNMHGWGGHYYKYAMREAMDIATIGCACTVRICNEHVDDIRLAFSVAAPTPIRCPSAEAVARGQAASLGHRASLLALVRNAVHADVQPRTSWRASAEFRHHIIATLAGRVLEEALRRAGVKA